MLTGPMKGEHMSRRRIGQDQFGIDGTQRRTRSSLDEVAALIVESVNAEVRKAVLR